jgi:hypothetical protein
VLGSSDAVARVVAAGAEAPVVACAADTVFGTGDLARFEAAFRSSGAAGAIAVRRDPLPGPGRPAVHIREGWVERVVDDDPGNPPLSAAPLWALNRPVLDRLCLDRPPYELTNAFRSALEAGERIAGIEIGKTRDLTDPLDLVEENFPYLKR